MRAGLRDLLGLMGYYVEEAGSGHEALMLLESASYDLMLLDMRMPGMDGIEVMRRAGQLRPDLLVIVLTAHATLDSAIAAVKSGAADYLHKPVNIDDLTVIISRALQERAENLRRQQLLGVIGDALDSLRQPGGPTPTPTPSPPSSRSPASPERFLQAGPLMLDCEKRVAVIKGDPARKVELTEGEAAILSTLMEHPNQVLSCDQLARVAMGYEVDKWDAQSLVRPYIFRLRRKIEKSPEKPALICTVRGRGYFLSPA